MLFVIFFFLLLLAAVFAEKKKDISIKGVLFIGIGVRLITLLLFPGSQSEDLRSFLYDANNLLRDHTKYYSLYFPFFDYVGLLFLKLQNYIHPLFSIKILFTLFDMGIVWLIYLLSKNSRLSLAYALNPISIITTTIHGQFDTAPLFFLLIGIYFFNKHREALSSLSLSLAVFTKTWPILFVAPLLRMSKRKMIFLLIAFIPILSIIIHIAIFKTPLIDILTPIKNYRGLYGFWGTSEILKPMKLLIPDHYIFFQQIVRRVFLLAFLMYSFTFSYKNALRGVTKLMLFFFVFTPTFGAQWLAWLVPFLILTKAKYLKFFLMGATVYLMIVFFSDVYTLGEGIAWIRDLTSHVAGFLVWLSVLALFRSFSPYR